MLDLLSGAIGVGVGLLAVALHNAQPKTATVPLRLAPEPSREQTDAALSSLLETMWTGDAGQIGLNMPRGSWRWKMRSALAAAAKVETAPYITQAEYDALLDERRHWRENAAIRVADLTRAVDGEHRLCLFGAKVPRSVVLQQLETWTDLLDEALSGKFTPLCEACGKHVRPGEICVPDVNAITLHADCDHPRPGKYQAGQVLALDHVVTTDESGEETIGPGEVQLYAETPLYTDVEIANFLAWAKDKLGREQGAPAKAEVA